MLSVKAYARTVSDEIVDCIVEASKRYSVPSELILAIIDIESGFHPYAVNVAGKSMFFENEEDAIKKIKELAGCKKSFDIGLMQVNRWWFDKLSYSYELGVNVCFNINLGAYILAYEISRNGFNWESIGMYHSKTETRKREYAFKIWKKLKKLK